MTTETAPSTHEKEHGMSDAGYIRIALILAAITALEVSTLTLGCSFCLLC
jgi:hypothetical protein